MLLPPPKGSGFPQIKQRLVIYEYVKTETAQNGDVKHVFKAKKVEIATGITSNFVMSAMTAIAALATGSFVVLKKKKK